MSVLGGARHWLARGGPGPHHGALRVHRRPAGLLGRRWSPSPLPDSSSCCPRACFRRLRRARGRRGAPTTSRWRRSSRRPARVRKRRRRSTAATCVVRAFGGIRRCAAWPEPGAGEIVCTRGPNGSGNHADQRDQRPSRGGSWTGRAGAEPTLTGRPGATRSPGRRVGTYRSRARSRTSARSTRALAATFGAARCSRRGPRRGARLLESPGSADARRAATS